MTEGFSRFSALENVPPSLRRGVVAIGNFDGVHRGHQAVLKKALEEAQVAHLPALVFTFEPHPREYFQPKVPFRRITQATEKALLLQKLGFHGVIEQAFTKGFAQQSAQAFVEKVLYEQLAVRALVVGHDFHFGAHRLGTPSFLKERAAEFGIPVYIVAPFCMEMPEFSGAKAHKDTEAPFSSTHLVSSSRIRHFLAQGKVTEANLLLGYSYFVRSEVKHGAKLGRKLGFPTANMHLGENFVLPYGVYAVRFIRANGQILEGVASFGCRPTIGPDKEPILESYLFNFSEEIYGETAQVVFFRYLRPELKFDTLDTLVAQMHCDTEAARDALKQIKPLSSLDKMLFFNQQVS